MRAMAGTADGRRALIELKAVDRSYPLYGKVTLDPDMPLDRALEPRNGAFGAAVISTLMARLDLQPGARLTVGTATFEIVAAIKSEPDKLASGIGFGPRVIVSEAALRATGLLVPGSLVRWNYRIRLADGSDRSAQAAFEGGRTQFPESGWQIRTRTTRPRRWSATSSASRSF